MPLTLTQLREALASEHTAPPLTLDAIRSALEEEDPIVQTALGDHCILQRGDFKRAILWYQRAAQQENSMACQQLSYLADNLSDADIATQAHECILLLAESGQRWAQKKCGDRAFLEKKYGQSLKWYNKVCLATDLKKEPDDLYLESFAGLKECAYFEKENIRVTAQKILTHLARLRHPLAQEVVGDFFQEGRLEGQPDFFSAIRYYVASGLKKNQQALEKLIILENILSEQSEIKAKIAWHQARLSCAKLEAFFKQWVEKEKESEPLSQEEPPASLEFETVLDAAQENPSVESFESSYDEVFSVPESESFDAIEPEPPQHTEGACESTFSFLEEETTEAVSGVEESHIASPSTQLDALIEEEPLDTEGKEIVDLMNMDFSVPLPDVPIPPIFLDQEP